jgi:hypothetical protein
MGLRLDAGMTNAVDYGALGFTASVDDVASLLALTRAEAIDLIRARDLPSLLLSAPTPSSPAGFRVHVDEVRALAERRSLGTLTVDERVRAVTQARLRDYLAARPPVEDYDEAIESGHALWGRALGGRRTLNIQADAVVRFFEEIDPRIALTESSIAMTLERIGGVKVRGVIPWSTPGGKQRWATMYRVPQSLLDGGSEDLLVRDVTAGQREPGEEVRRRPGSAAHVVGKAW